MTTGSPSPTPWKADTISLRDANGKWLVDLSYAANAALIVQAVNAFAPMLEAMKTGLEALHAFHPLLGEFPGWVENCDLYACRKLWRAIALAEGKEK